VGDGLKTDDGKPLNWFNPFPHLEGRAAATLMTIGRWSAAVGVSEGILQPVESGSFNAQPQTPAIFVVGPGRAGACGWALNEGMCQSTPVAV
jgi:hypothetical protein